MFGLCREFLQPICGCFAFDDNHFELGVSENSVPLNPMVLLIIIPIKWLFHWEYTLFSDKPNCDSPQATQARRLWLLRASTVCSNFWHDANSRPPFEWVPMAALEALASLNALSNWSSHRNQSSSNRFL